MGDDAGEFVVAGCDDHRQHTALTGAHDHRAPPEPVPGPRGGVKGVGDEISQTQYPPDARALTVPLGVDAHDGDALGGKAIAELFIEQRMGHGSRQEHHHRAVRSAVPHRQHNRHARGGNRHLLVALRVLNLIAQPLISIAHAHHHCPCSST